MRIVLDTNVYVSATLSKGNPYYVFNSAERGESDLHTVLALSTSGGTTSKSTRHSASLYTRATQDIIEHAPYKIL